MGQLVEIKLKTDNDIEIRKINSILKKMKIENRFSLEQDNIDWLKDINTNLKSPQSHLKPADRDLTLEELKELFTRWTETEIGRAHV